MSRRYACGVLLTVVAIRGRLSGVVHGPRRPCRRPGCGHSPHVPDNRDAIDAIVRLSVDGGLLLLLLLAVGQIE